VNDVTAIVCTFLRDEYLFNCIRSLKQHYPNIRILVADDGHISDEKERALTDLGVERYVRLPFNVGLPAKRNALLALVETY
jgi:glycosyltransferase involved in cell wall biosynthesis